MNNENKKESEINIISETTKTDWKHGKSCKGQKDNNNNKWKVDSLRNVEYWTMAKNKKQKQMEKDDDKMDIKDTSDNQKNYYDTMLEDEKKV